MTSTTVSALRVGISTPWDFPELAPDAQRARLALAADVGIDHVFTADHVSFHGGSGIDALIRLAALGAMEPRLDLYAGVMLIALRHPMVAARQIASLVELMPGRLVMGVGVGGEDRHEFEVCGIDPATRGRRTDAALRIVRALLDGETVDGDGEFYDFVGGRIKPVPTARVPFVVGGRSDAALQRTAQLGDGWLATWCSARRFAEATARVHELATDRDVDWQHGLQPWVGVGSSREDARPYVASRMQAFYKIPFERFERYTAYGTPTDIAEFLAPYVEAGATTLNISACGADPEEALAAIAEVKRLLV